MKEKKARVDDALHATRAAVEEGIVPGGGVALVRGIAKIADMTGETTAKRRVLRLFAARWKSRCVRSPATPALKEPLSSVESVASKKGSYGFNARSEEYGDMVKMGVIDPTKVVRTALSNAASIAGLLLTTDALITDEEEEEEEGT